MNYLNSFSTHNFLNTTTDGNESRKGKKKWLLGEQTKRGQKSKHVSHSLGELRWMLLFSFFRDYRLKNMVLFFRKVSSNGEV